MRSGPANEEGNSGILSVVSKPSKLVIYQKLGFNLFNGKPSMNRTGDLWISPAGFEQSSHSFASPALLRKRRIRSVDALRWVTWKFPKSWGIPSRHRVSFRTWWSIESIDDLGLALFQKTRIWFWFEHMAPPNEMLYHMKRQLLRGTSHFQSHSYRQW